MYSMARWKIHYHFYPDIQVIVKNADAFTHISVMLIGIKTIDISRIKNSLKQL
jgi:hypothetical protein